jgi:hypothetical protein
MSELASPSPADDSHPVYVVKLGEKLVDTVANLEARVDSLERSLTNLRELLAGELRP